MAVRSSVKPERKAFYDRIEPLNLIPLWEKFHDLVSPQPRTPCAPYRWRYAEARPHLLEAGELITAKEAERRVLILENPELRGVSTITRSLFAGWQLVMPFEVAPAHRHTPSALRLIVEGSGAYTAIDGERVPMAPGDLIITRPWGWHDHGNETEEPVIWLDGLDLPMVRFFDTGFTEFYEADTYPAPRPAGDNLARYGANMAPVGRGPDASAYPLYSYPYDRSREALERMRAAGELDPSHGLKMEFTNPADGGPAMPTMSTFIQLLPKGFETEPYRATDGTVYTVIEGSGESTIGGETFTWEARDVFVVPSWYPHHHRAGADSVLFSFSDRVAQQKLGLWREQA